MKRLLLVSAIIINTVFAYSQSVAVNTNGTPAHPSAVLDVSADNKGMLIPRMPSAQRIIIPAPATGLQVFDTDTKSFWFWNGVAWVQLSTGAATNFWTANGAYIFNNNAGNVGIGTSTPANKFTVQTPAGDYGFAHTDATVTVASWVGDFSGATGGWLGTKSNHPLNFFANGGSSRMTILPNGNVGIGTITPTNKFQINGITPGFTDYDFAIGRNAQVMAIYQGPNFTNLQSTANITLNPQNGTGFVGINVGGNPSNKLQIGTMGAAGFTGNDLAIGNGTNAMVVYQSNASTLIASTTDIALMPRNNGQGRVGINTNTPRAPLDVVSENSITALSSFYSYLNFASFNNGIGASSTPTTAQSVSIMASGRVYASEFDAYSDGRIKSVKDISNSQMDLQIINALAITDYTMKDRVKYGNKIFKKVIAQEVEKVYPQIVSKHIDFIPNVYQVTSGVIKTRNGYLLRFSGKHNISKEAKKLRVLLSDTEGMQVLEVVSVPSATEVVINATDVKTDKVFVYGEEVDDFRTVDYEGLTTLNISATQELSKLLKKQQLQLDEQNKKIEQLMEMVRASKELRIASAAAKL